MNKHRRPCYSLCSSIHNDVISIHFIRLSHMPLSQNYKNISRGQLCTYKEKFFISFRWFLFQIQKIFTELAVQPRKTQNAFSRIIPQYSYKMRILPYLNTKPDAQNPDLPVHRILFCSNDISTTSEMRRSWNILSSRKTVRPSISGEIHVRGFWWDFLRNSTAIGTALRNGRSWYDLYIAN